MKNFKQPNYVYYVFARGTNGQYGFSSYQDMTGALGKPGKVVCISYRLDKHNNDEPYHFNFSMRDRTIKVRVGEQDKNGVLITDFLDNHPECKDSPNGMYLENGEQLNVYFKKADEEADTEKLLNAKLYRIEAEKIAANLEDKEVLELASLFGQFSLSTTMARHTVMEIAGNKPQIFMEYYNDPNRRAKSIIQRGVRAGVLTVNGAAIHWNKTLMGMDEVEAASLLMKDPTILDALALAIKNKL